MHLHRYGQPLSKRRELESIGKKRTPHLIEHLFRQEEGIALGLYLLFLTKRTKNKISTIAIPDSRSDADSVKKMIKDYGLEVLQDRVKSISELVGDAKVKDIEDLYQN